MSFAPHGQPGHHMLRDTWLFLERKWKVMHSSLREDHYDVQKWASEAADRIRLMCRHCISLKSSMSPYLAPELHELLEEKLMLNDNTVLEDLAEQQHDVRPQSDQAKNY